MQIQPASLSAPLVVSVSGHRDLWKDEKGRDALTEALGNELIKLEEQFKAEESKLKKHTQFVPQRCVLLSALAAGADTLAADVALSLGWKVIAPLPLPVEEYARDFEDDSLDEFYCLLHKCPHFFIGYAPGCNAENTAKTAENKEKYHDKFRDRQYAYVGEFLTRHCEVLVALWDGEPSGGTGGTGDVVRMQREGAPADCMEVRWSGTLLDSPEGGRVIHIWTARQKNNGVLPKGKEHGEVEPPEEDEADQVEPPAEDASRTKKPRRKRKTRVNGQTKKHIEARRKNWTRFLHCADGLGATTPEKVEGFPLEICRFDSHLEAIRDAHWRAGKLAGDLKTEVNARFKRVLGAGFGFTLCVSVALWFADDRFQFKDVPWSIGPLLASWAFLVLAYGVVARSGDVANRFQDYRALAEAWRVAYFWRAVGIEDAVDAAYLRGQRGELDWIRQALRTGNLQWRCSSESGPLSSEETANRFRLTFEDWVEGQIKYFHGKFPKDRQRLTSLRNWSLAWLLFGLGMSAVAIVAQIKVEGRFTSNYLKDFWLFLQTFASANALTSPLVPGVLSLAHMRSWPYATEDNTRETKGETDAETEERTRLHDWFLRQRSCWRMVAFIGSLLLLLGVVAALNLHTTPSNQSNQLIPWLQVIATIAFFLPAIIYANAAFEALPEHVTRYERMFGIYERAKKMLEEIAAVSGPDPKGKTPPAGKPLDWNDPQVQAKAKRIYRELGREALHENGEWLLIHRERPLDIEA